MQPVFTTSRLLCSARMAEVQELSPPLPYLESRAEHTNTLVCFIMRCLFIVCYHMIGVGEHKLRVKNQGKYLFEDFHALAHNTV